MGLIEAIEGTEIYLDTNIWIYAVEAFPDYVDVVRGLFEAIDQGQFIAITSELTIAEVLVQPFRNNNLAIVEAYQHILQSSDHVKVIPINRGILATAAQLRATTRLKLPDAIHLATAIAQNASTFITNDAGFQSMSDLPILQLAEFL